MKLERHIKQIKLDVKTSCVTKRDLQIISFRRSSSFWWSLIAKWNSENIAVFHSKGNVEEIRRKRRNERKISNNNWLPGYFIKRNWIRSTGGMEMPQTEFLIQVKILQQ